MGKSKNLLCLCEPFKSLPQQAFTHPRALPIASNGSYYQVNG